MKGEAAAAIAGLDVDGYVFVLHWLASRLDNGAAVTVEDLHAAVEAQGTSWISAL